MNGPRPSNSQPGGNDMAKKVSDEKYNELLARAQARIQGNEKWKSRENDRTVELYRVGLDANGEPLSTNIDNPPSWDEAATTSTVNLSENYQPLPIKTREVLPRSVTPPPARQILRGGKRLVRVAAKVVLDQPKLIRDGNGGWIIDEHEND